MSVRHLVHRPGEGGGASDIWYTALEREREREERQISGAPLWGEGRVSDIWNNIGHLVHRSGERGERLTSGRLSDIWYIAL